VAQIKFLRSSTAGVVPVGLTYGEIAINVADRKLYVGGTGGDSVLIDSGGSGGGTGTETTWTLTAPTTAVDIAGVPVGTTFAVGTNAISILEDILYPTSVYGTVDGGTFP
jgi:hypothetical protein